MYDKQISRLRLPVSVYKKGILNGDRSILSRAITLIESKLVTDQVLANKLLQALLPLKRGTIRIGITGVPGVGKSSFIEAFGQYLTAMSKKIAVLTVDPSSQRTKGSILGDKTRMEVLSRDSNVFIRPTASGATLGGVHDKTREAILLCEAAGFEVIIVETVGVGQSEMDVRNMVDFFMLLLLGGAGDELQGIKKGIMEMADGMVITKSDGENIKQAKEAQLNYKHALHLFPPSESGYTPHVLLSSALRKTGIEEVWKVICDFQQVTSQNDFFAIQRNQQMKAWFYSALDNGLRYEIMQSPLLKRTLKRLEAQVASEKLIPPQASQQLITKFIHLLSAANMKE